MTQLVVAHTVEGGGKGGSHRSPAAALHRALGSDGRDVYRAVGHRSVSSVAGKAKSGELPIGWDAPLDNRVEHLHPVVGAVGALETVLDAGSIRAHVIFEGGRLGVSGGPDRAIIVVYLVHRVDYVTRDVAEIFGPDLNLGGDVGVGSQLFERPAQVGLGEAVAVVRGLIEVVDAQFQGSLDDLPLLLGRSPDHQSSIAAASKAYLGHQDTRVAQFPEVQLALPGQTCIIGT